MIGGDKRPAEAGLYYFNARWYDSSLGRFITEDPIKDGTNWYIYCSNNPLSFVDPTGLDPSYAGMDSNLYYSGNKTPFFGYNKKFAQTQTDLVGKDYIWGGNDPVKDGGVDCSGSILYGLKEMGYTLPDMTANEIVKKLTLPVEDKSFIEGDIRGLHAKGKVVHVQTLLEDGRVNPTGGPENDLNNPGEINELEGAPPASGTMHRIDWGKVENLSNQENENKRQENVKEPVQ
ncbi:MAG: C40 family peptidase [Spirochaetaceae bacterium]|nr:C40 family peptidase [Spirochaetaceae bacterium]